MALTNTAKPSTSFDNTDRVAFAELWSTILTTWATETKTWQECVSLFTNEDKHRSLGSYTFDEIGDQTIEETGGALSDSSFMLNMPKP